MINFHTLALKNFMSFGDEAVTIKLDKSPTTLVTGANGHGKSSIFEALTFVLFNKSFRGINKPALVNTINQKSMEVAVAFDDGKDSYSVLRGIKPNVFKILKNGEALDDQADAKDQQKTLEEILGFTFDEYIKTVMLGHANFKPFMQLTGPERRSFVDAVLNLEVYSKMSKLHRENVRELTSTVSNIERDIETNNSKKQTAQQAIFTIENTVKDQIKDAQSVYDAVKDLPVDKSTYLENMSSLKEQRSELQAGIQKVKVMVDGINAEQRADQILINRLKSDIANLNTSDECPTCGGPIDVSNIIKHQGEMKARIVSTEETIASRVPMVEKYNAAITAGNSKIEAINDQLNDLSRDIEIANSNARRIDDAKTALDRAKSKSGQNTDSFKELVGEMEKANVANDTKLSELRETKRVYDAATELLKDSGIKAQMIDRYIPLLNKYANHHLATMNAPFRIEIDREFNDRIVGRYKDEFTYVSLSQGERCRVDLAMLFAWLQVATDSAGVGTSVIILDEIGASELDADGVESMFAILEEVCHNKNVFIISHRADIAQRCRSVIEIEKRNGFSKLV